MRAASVTQVGAGVSSVLALDYVINPVDITLSTSVTPPVNYTIQVTTDDIQSPTYNPATGTWYNIRDTVMVGATTGAYSKLDQPFTGARINNSGGGTVILTARQGIKG